MVVVFLVLQFTARPYIQDRMDILEGLCSISVFFYVFAGMLFTNADLSKDEEVSEHTCAPTRKFSHFMHTVVCSQLRAFIPQHFLHLRVCCVPVDVSGCSYIRTKCAHALCMYGGHEL